MKIVDLVARVNNKINQRQIDWNVEYVILRKLAHTVEYSALGVAASLFFSDRKHTVLNPLIFCAIISIVDQMSKIAIPGREFDITDWPFDFLGYVIGVLVIATGSVYWKKRRQSL